MNKLELYLENCTVSFLRMPLAILGKYQAVQGDSWLKNVLVTLDQLGNALTFGDPNETISSRSAKAQLAGEEWGCVMCKLLSWFQTNHCQLALERDKGRRAVIPDANP